MLPGAPIRALRTFKNEKAYDDPVWGTDQQPKHLKDKYVGQEDRGGVHWNSGIPNHAFYLAAMALGGKAWSTLGAIWYETLRRLTKTSNFADAARISIQAAGETPIGSPDKQRAVRDAWVAVGVVPPV
jgi:Zn-dependent metalloprotease